MSAGVLPAAPRTIVIVGQPRSGTNHVSRLMESFSGLLVHYEVFNHRRLNFHWKFRLEALAALSGRRFSGFEDPALNRWVRTHPAEVVDLLHREAGAQMRAVTLKIFRRHLDIAQFEAALAARPDSAFLFMRRRPIDAYISFRKAAAIDTLMAVDTTGLAPELDADAYAEWWRGQVGWFGDTLAAVRRHRRPHAFICYERDVAGPERATLAMLRARLREIDYPARIRGDVRLKQPVKRVLAAAARAAGRDALWRPALGLTRQDLSPTTAAKVAN